MTVTREIIAENIAELRRGAHLTQLELAEKLNYSDKAISKWERGDSIPDVFVLAELAELFSVNVDYFLHKHTEDEKKPVLEADKKRTRLAISLTSCLSPYVIAIALFFILGGMRSDYSGLWRIFILAMPAVSVIGIVFSSMWAKNKAVLFTFVSVLLWSLCLSLFVFIYSLKASWFVFVIGAPLQLIILLWFFVVSKKTKRSK